MTLRGQFEFHYFQSICIIFLPHRLHFRQAEGTPPSLNLLVPTPILSPSPSMVWEKFWNSSLITVGQSALNDTRYLDKEEDLLATNYLSISVYLCEGNTFRYGSMTEDFGFSYSPLWVDQFITALQLIGALRMEIWKFPRVRANCAANCAAQLAQRRVRLFR